MEIKILEITKGCSPMQFDCGDWYDLYTAETVSFKAPVANKMHIRGKNKENSGEKVRDVTFDSGIIKLGVAMQLPDGYEAIVAPRSSTFKKHGIIESNSFGVIDNSYCGDTDEWGFPVVATREVTIPKGTRIAQFRIQLSQKATVWQKIKWLFSSKPRLVSVTSLNNKSRGGFGEGTKHFDK